MNVQEVAEAIRAKAEKAGFKSQVKFDLGQDGVFVLDGTAVSSEDGPADCVVTISLQDLASVVSGELDPTGAFASGKLKVDGDMSTALALAQII